MKNIIVPIFVLITVFFNFAFASVEELYNQKNLLQQKIEQLQKQIAVIDENISKKENEQNQYFKLYTAINKKYKNLNKIKKDTERKIDSLNSKLFLLKVDYMDFIKAYNNYIDAWRSSPPDYSTMVVEYKKMYRFIKGLDAPTPNVNEDNIDTTSYEVRKWMLKIGGRWVGRELTHCISVINTIKKFVSYKDMIKDAIDASKSIKSTFEYLKEQGMDKVKESVKEKAVEAAKDSSSFIDSFLTFVDSVSDPLGAFQSELEEMQKKIEKEESFGYETKEEALKAITNTLVKTEKVHDNIENEMKPLKESLNETLKAINDVKKEIEALSKIKKQKNDEISSLKKKIFEINNKIGEEQFQNNLTEVNELGSSESGEMECESDEGNYIGQTEKSTTYTLSETGYDYINTSVVNFNLAYDEVTHALTGLPLKSILNVEAAKTYAKIEHYHFKSSCNGGYVIDQVKVIKTAYTNKPVANPSNLNISSDVVECDVEEHECKAKNIDGFVAKKGKLEFNASWTRKIPQNSPDGNYKELKYDIYNEKYNKTYNITVYKVKPVLFNHYVKKGQYSENELSDKIVFINVKKDDLDKVYKIAENYPIGYYYVDNNNISHFEKSNEKFLRKKTKEDIKEENGYLKGVIEYDVYSSENIHVFKYYVVLGSIILNVNGKDIVGTYKEENLSTEKYVVKVKSNIPLVNKEDFNIYYYYDLMNSGFKKKNVKLDSAVAFEGYDFSAKLTVDLKYKKYEPVYMNDFILNEPGDTKYYAYAYISMANTEPSYYEKPVGFYPKDVVFMRNDVKIAKGVHKDYVKKIYKFTPAYKINPLPEIYFETKNGITKNYDIEEDYFYTEELVGKRLMHVSYQVEFSKEYKLYKTKIEDDDLQFQYMEKQNNLMNLKGDGKLLLDYIYIVPYARWGFEFKNDTLDRFLMVELRGEDDYKNIKAEAVYRNNNTAQSDFTSFNGKKVAKFYPQDTQFEKINFYKNSDLITYYVTSDKKNDNEKYNFNHEIYDSDYNMIRYEYKNGKLQPTKAILNNSMMNYIPFITEEKNILEIDIENGKYFTFIGLRDFADIYDVKVNANSLSFKIGRHPEKILKIYKEPLYGEVIQSDNSFVFNFKKGKKDSFAISLGEMFYIYKSDNSYGKYGRIFKYDDVRIVAKVDYTNDNPKISFDLIAEIPEVIGSLGLDFYEKFNVEDKGLSKILFLENRYMAFDYTKNYYSEISGTIKLDNGCKLHVKRLKGSKIITNIPKNKKIKVTRRFWAADLNHNNSDCSETIKVTKKSDNIKIFYNNQPLNVNEEVCMDDEFSFMITDNGGNQLKNTYLQVLKNFILDTGDNKQNVLTEDKYYFFDMVNPEKIKAYNQYTGETGEFYENEIPNNWIVGEVGDYDNDGINDIADSDDDNDGILDADEVIFGLDPKNSTDAFDDYDNDGISNKDAIFIHRQDIFKNQPNILNLKKGWNLVTENISFDDINSSKVIIAWTYENGKWEGYSSNEKLLKLIKESPNFNVLTTVKPYKGIWLYVKDDCNISFNVSQTDYQIHTGWNLLGANKILLVDDIKNDGKFKNCKFLWKYINGDKMPWKLSIIDGESDKLPGYRFDVIRRGEGFWIYCK